MLSEPEQPPDTVALKRPACPQCGLEMILVTVWAGRVFLGWMCDCMYRNTKEELIADGIIANLVRAREFDETFLIYRLEFPNTDSEV